MLQPSKVQTKGRSFVCVRLCSAKLSTRAKAAPQSGKAHTNGFSPECVRVCVVKCSSREKERPHPSCRQGKCLALGFAALPAGARFRFMPRPVGPPDTLTRSAGPSSYSSSGVRAAPSDAARDAAISLSGYGGLQRPFSFLSGGKASNVQQRPHFFVPP